MNEDGAVVFNLIIPWNKIKKAYDRLVDLALAEIEIDGFRKGKAPRDLAMKKIDAGKIRGEVINQLLPEAYAEEIKKRNLKPIVSPKIQVIGTEENKDWEFKVTLAEKPTVDLGDYRSAIKTAKIWKPGDKTEETLPVDDKETPESRSQRINEIVNKLLETAKIKVPKMLVAEETARLIATLIDDVRAAGLTFEQYLTSKGITNEALMTQYQTQAETVLKLEFILGEIADRENITVSPAEIEAVINKEKDTKIRESLRAQSYLLASVLRREKTLTFLANL